MEPLPKPIALDTPEFVIRDLDDSKLEAAIRLWESDSGGAPLAFSLADVLGAIAARQPGLVALAGENVAGAIAARVDAPRAWVLRWSVATEWRRRGIGAELLRALERRLLALGVRDISMLVPGSGEAADTARAAGYVQHEGVLYLEQRRLQTTASEDRVEELGGQSLPAELWGSIGGMEREKDLRSQYFSAADIEFAARKAAQAAFERSLGAGFAPATTDEFLTAIAEVRPSITAAMAREFDEDIDRFARF